MCGIVGIIKKNDTSVDESLLQRMNDKIVHRGPDAEGIFVDKKIGFGHRRLAILDLSEAGTQPMVSVDERFVLTYNGEIYNYKELREELEKLGAVFHTETDTEVIIEAYRYWGSECTKRFNGMWAFALYDKEKQTVLFSRDRFGVKPLYVYENETELVFASEIKCILEIYPEERIPDVVELRRYLVAVQEDSDEHTFYQNIKNFPRSHNMVFHLTSNERMEYAYWKVDVPLFCEKWKCHNVYKKCRELLEDSIRIRLRADVNVGASLSGGLDSSTILGIVSKKFRRKMYTFSSIYEQKECDEKEFIDCMNEFAKAEPHYIYPDKEKDLIEDLKEMTYFHDSPCHGASPYSGFCVYRGVGDSVKVMLDGQGSDEIFGGYMFFFKHKLNDFMKKNTLWTRMRAICMLGMIHATWPGHLQTFTHQQENLLDLLGEDGYDYFVKKGILPELKERPPISEIFQDGFAVIDMQKKGRPDDSVVGDLARELDIRLRYKMLPSMLHDVDRNSMARSLEVRLPFLDYRLVEFAYTLTTEQRIRRTWTKYVLRRSCKRYMPKKVWSRRNKMGFPAPFAKWIEDERYQDRILGYLESFKGRGIVKPEEIDKRYQRQLSREGDYTEILFRCMMTELWLQEEIDREQFKWGF